MAFSSKSYFVRDTNNSTRTYARAADHSSYKYYNNFTLSMWVMAQPGTNKTLISQWESVASNNRSFLISTQDDGTLRTIFSWDGTSFSLHKTTNAVFDFSWIHLMVSFANGVQTVYVNNVAQVMIQTLSWGGGAAGLFASGQKQMIGGHDPAAPGIDQSFGGCWNNFSKWNIVLDSTQRAELYNLGRPGDLSLHSAYANLTNWVRADQSEAAPTTSLADVRAGSGADMAITKSGTNPFFTQTNNYPKYNTDPGVANVRLATGYVYDGDAKTGTAVIPSLANTKTGAAGDGGAGTYDGSDRWTDPGVANVRLGEVYKANSTSNNRTGLVAVPSVGNTKTGVATDQSTGTYDGSDRWTDPTEANVRSGTAYKSNSTSNNKLGTLIVPSLANTKVGVAGDGGTGTYDGTDRHTHPTAGQIKNGISIKNNSLTDNVTGTYQGDDVNDVIDAAELKHGVTVLNRNVSVLGTYRAYDLWEALEEEDVKIGVTALQDGESVVGAHPGLSPPSTVRSICNAILTFIGASTLTDEEYDGLTLEVSSPAADVYNQLLIVLNLRGSLDTETARLLSYFLAKGVQLEETPDPTEDSKIFLGGGVGDAEVDTDDGISNLLLGGELEE